MKYDLQKITDQSGTFSISDAFSKGWEIVSRHIWYYILGGILAILSSGFIGMIPYIGSLVNSLVVQPAFAAGAIYVTWRISMGHGWRDFSDMFQGFRMLPALILSTLIATAIIIILFLPFLLLNLETFIELLPYFENNSWVGNEERVSEIFISMLNPTNIVIWLITSILIITLTVLWLFRNYFIVIFNAEAWESLEASRKIAAKNFWLLIGFGFVISLVVLISVIPLGLGLFFSLPWSMGAMYSAFAQITGCEEQTRVENISPENIFPDSY